MHIKPLFLGIMFLSEISKHGMQVGGSLPLSIIPIVIFIEVNNSYIATGWSVLSCI